MFVVLAAALYLFAGAGGGDVQTYECWHMGWDCKGEGCGPFLPTAPTRSYHYVLHRCCLEGGPDGRDWCHTYELETGSCCDW